MEEQTITKLNDLTQQFYNTVSESFSQTRQLSWEGWKAIPEILVKSLNTQKLNVLDIGCGNGRFATFLHESVDCGVLYTGVDTNTELLLRTKAVIETLEKSNREKNFEGIVAELDLVAELLKNNFNIHFADKNFTVITAFGVLHHIPTAKLRQKFLEAISQILSENGVCIISLWRFAEFERYQSKKLDPAEFGIADRELEANDFLLGWKDQKNIARYCHSFTEQEISGIIKNSNLRLLTQYQADGKEGTANTYLVLQKQQG